MTFTSFCNSLNIFWLIFKHAKCNVNVLVCDTYLLSVKIISSYKLSAINNVFCINISVKFSYYQSSHFEKCSLLLDIGYFIGGIDDRVEYYVNRPYLYVFLRVSRNIFFVLTPQSICQCHGFLLLCR